MNEHANILTPSKQTSPVAIAHDVAEPALEKEQQQLLPIQCSLSVGAPDDPLEDEADAMADTVMRMPLIQRKCASCEEEEKVQRKPLSASITPFVQRKTNGEATTSTALTSRIKNSQGSGTSMDGETRSFMENRFGSDFSSVKIHTGNESVMMNRELSAKAFTVGNDIYFNEGQYNPDSNSGKHLLAHELTHTIQQGTKQSIQSKLIQRVHGDRFGQATEDHTRNLVCDLTSPLTVGSMPRYEVGQHGDELGPEGAMIIYRWSVIDRRTNRELSAFSTNANTITLPAATAGRFRVMVEIMSNGIIFSTLSLDQDVVVEDAFLTGMLMGSTGADVDAYREMVNDFRPYILNAARATGPDGITPAMLASVLMVEATNRPKEDREEENNDVGGYLASSERGSWLLPWQSVNHSIGVGQIRLSTAAMVLGYTPWIDQDRNDRSAGRDAIDSNFEGISFARKRNIYNLLRWPKSNITMAANLLSHLKNRTNRYPLEDRTTFAVNSRGVQIIATEYNQGATSSSAADASPAIYGTWVWDYIHSDPIIQNYFPNE